jgi:hypothetical protein
MGVSTALIIIIVALAAGSVGLWAYRRSSAQPRIHNPKHEAKPVANAKVDAKNQAEQWGVRIGVPAKEKACPEARKIIGKEFPIDQKPSLPLPHCPYPHQCACYYTKLFDRRKTERRSGEERRAEGHRIDSKDRRSGRDRRKKQSDIDWA